ncbi:MAG TPA: TIGR03013 family XrtA/PEP-CTERM system glycosyltransferase [Steroidobacteraceae bacterium]|nr:TIGR03013 family XrtA/PEP-CTERM system glycosyltransferase [Steroidobacteraceae bacterium]
MRIRMLGHNVPVSMAVLSAIEAMVFFAAVYGAVMARFGVSPISVGDLPELRGALWPRALLFSVVMMICFLAFGLYSLRQRARLAGIALRVAIALAAGFVITATLFYLVPALWMGRGVVALAAIGGLCGVTISRLIFSHVVDEDVFKRRVLVYGAGESAAAIAGLRRRADRRGFVVAGFVPTHPAEHAVAHDRIIDPHGNLVRLCEKLSVVEVVVAMDDRRSGFPLAELLKCRLAGIDVTELLTFLERETGRVRLDVLNPSWMIFGQGFRRDPLRLVTSRVLDLIGSLAVLTLTLPFILMTALALKVQDGWSAPVLYRQRRVGLGGRPFNVLKFRSMHVDAERDGRARWAQARDPRVTRVGSFIRKTRLDELPQLLNVLRGQMSLVGPRPERPEFVAELAERIPYYVERHCVKPGLTGWAQLCYPYGSSEQDALEKLQYDLYYVKNNSLLFDLAILLQTAEVVVMGTGAR